MKYILTPHIRKRTVKVDFKIHKTKDFICSDCLTGFTQKKDLNKHRKAFHVVTEVFDKHIR